MINKINKRKLKLADIAKYFPYNLECIFKPKSGFNVRRGYLAGYNFNSPVNNFYEKGFHLYGYDLDEVNPILRPMSDLLEEIEHDGETFTPLTRLYEIAVVSIYNHIPEYELKMIDSDDEEFGLIVYENESKNRNGFSYNITDNTFKLTIDNHRRTDSEMRINQYLLSEQLIKWKFDIGGLIEIGLAKDINTL